jgi:hypothetical protein
MNIHLKLAAAVLACASVCACGTNYNGTYSGTWTPAPTGIGSTSLSMTLYEQGSNVTGDWVSGTAAGTFSGTANGGTLNSGTFVVTSSGSNSAAGTLTLNNNLLSGTVGGTLGTSISVTLNQTQ